MAYTFRKLSGDTKVIVNPSTTGNESELTSLSVDGIIYTIPENTFTEDQANKLNGIEEGANKYVLPNTVVKDINYENFKNETQTKLASLENYDDTEVKESLENKVDKVIGKGLSTEDFTTAEKEKLATLEKLPENIVVDETYVHTDNNFTSEEKNKLSNLNNFDDTAIQNALNNKVEKIDGKGLSSNDFTDEEKLKLSNLSNFDATGIETTLENKVDKVNGKGLSTNDFTNEYKNKVDNIPTKTSQLTNDSDFLTSANLEDKATKDYVDNQIAAQAVNHYTKTETDLSLDLKANKADVYTKAEVDAKTSTSYKYRGTVDSYDSLPSADQTIGDVYNVLDTGDNYAWDGSQWDKLGGMVDLTHLASKEELDTKQNTLTQTQLEAVNSGINASKVGSYDAALTEIAALNTNLSNKVDKIEGKGLSTNDFTDEEKLKLAGLNNFDASDLQVEIDNKVNKVEGKGLSTNDFTTAEKEKLANLNNYDDSEIKVSLGNKVDKVEGKRLSTNDFTTAEKEKLAGLENYTEPEGLVIDKNYVHTDNNFTEEYKTKLDNLDNSLTSDKECHFIGVYTESDTLPDVSVLKPDDCILLLSETENVYYYWTGSGWEVLDPSVVKIDVELKGLNKTLEKYLTADEINNDFAKKVELKSTTTIESGQYLKVSLLPNKLTTAILSVRTTIGTGYGTFLITNYGAGTEARCRVQQLQGERSFSKYIDNCDLYIIPTVTDQIWYASIIPVHGDIPALSSSETYTGTEITKSVPKEILDSVISDEIVSTTSTYSSSKIDAKYGVYTFGTASATQWLKLTLGNVTKFQPITITDQYGGKVEITGMADDGTYKSVKLVRYSYGDWTTYSATDYTLYDGIDPNYKIQRLYYYPTNGCYYLEIRQWCTIKVSGAITRPEMVTALPADKSEMTLIPESAFASKNTLATVEKRVQGATPFNEIYFTDSRYRKLTVDLYYGRETTFSVNVLGYESIISVYSNSDSASSCIVKNIGLRGNPQSTISVKWGNFKSLTGSGHYQVDLFIYKATPFNTMIIRPKTQQIDKYSKIYTSADFVASSQAEYEAAEYTAITEYGNINDSSTGNTYSTWSSSKIASEINPTIDISKVFSDGVLDIAALSSTYGNGRYVVVGQGTTGNGSATIDIWTLASNAISYIVNVTYSNKTSNIFTGYTYDNPTINFETGFISGCNHIAKVCTLA